ncbi:MAG TPA: hypothetical protein VKW04_08360 [Planctomycetota bacterium]|nr:hypothetical protein [Planctomycetota bacterium]
MLKPSLASIVLGLLLAGSPLRAEAPQDELALTLNCKPPSFKVRNPPLGFTGSCPLLPNGVILRFDLARVTEMLSGVQLQSTIIAVGGGNSELENNKFNYTCTVDSPGKYQARMSIPLELQEQDHVAEVKKRTVRKNSWQFEFLVWGDDLVPLLSPKLLEINALVTESRNFVERVEAACQSEKTWQAQAKGLTLEGTKLSNKIVNSELKAYYPAAMTNLNYTLRSVVNNTPYYAFTDGKFAGAKDYHADSKKVSTHRNEDFTWENLKRYVEETLPCAGREFSLWMVKDLRRTAGQMRSEIQEAVKSQKAHPGVDLYVDRLVKATIGDLDGLETDIRGVDLKK